MMELLGVSIPSEAISGLAFGGAAFLSVIVYLQSLDPPEPLQPWRWGDAPRRPESLDGAIGHFLGALLAASLIAAALAQALA